MATLSKAQLIEVYPQLKLKMSMKKDEMLAIIKDAEKPAKKSTRGKNGEY